MSVQQIDWDSALLRNITIPGHAIPHTPPRWSFQTPSAQADFHSAVARYPERPLSLYVHIPFCHKLCYFCGCNKIVTRQQHKADQVS